ncbi:MAG: hypothetical protein R3F11_12845 [Verrucomicrobiales bacterium]
MTLSYYLGGPVSFLAIAAAASRCALRRHGASPNEERPPWKSLALA